MYKTILVALNHADHVKSNLRVAKMLADKFDAHITGLFVIPSVQTVTTSELGATTVYSDLHSLFETRAEKTKEIFKQETERFKSEWRLVDSIDFNIDAGVVEHGRQSDLIVLGFDEVSGKADGSSVDLASRVIQSSGRPVMLVPNRIPRARTIKRAVIGWNGSKEAARAAFDAAPILRLAKEVVVLTVNPNKDFRWPVDTPGSEIATSLSRHGVKVTTDSIKVRGRTGKAILSYCNDDDLLVLGAYGHSRIHETILGGVTHSTLEDMHCMTLMSN